MDALTYAGNLDNLTDISDSSNYRFVKANIRAVSYTHLDVYKRQVLFYVPAVYNVIGSRYEVLIEGLLFGEIEAGTSFYYRNKMALQGLRWFAEKPVFGYGLDAYSLLSPYKTYSHNNFIEMLVNTGIVGFLLYYCAIFVLLIRANKKRKMDDLGNEGSAVVAFTIAILIMNVSHVDYVYRNALICMYMFAAFAFEKNRATKYKLPKGFGQKHAKNAYDIIVVPSKQDIVVKNESILHNS